MLQTLQKIFAVKELRKKLLLTIGLLVLYRVLAHIPLPGVNLQELQKFFSKNQIFGLLDIFSGGTLRTFSIVLMGVGPYITSSIIFQLLTMVVPSLEALQKEGEFGRQKINHYTRILSVPLALLQAYGTFALLRGQGVLQPWDLSTLILMLISATAGTVLLMWIGELISENGVGNGISLLIGLGIVASVPTSVYRALSLIGVNFTNGTLNFDNLDTGRLALTIGFLVVALIITGAIILITEAERQLPVTYARRARGNTSVGTVESRLPLRVNAAGVIPIIFAISLMLFPGVLASFLAQARTPWLANAAVFIQHLFNNQTFYATAYFTLVVLFTYFYTSIIFRPSQVAENLQKQGGFIPGIRPGRETADYLNFIVTRITVAGAVFLGLVAILPFLMQSITHTPALVLGGTGILIVVSVVIETMRQIKAQLVMRTYEDF